MSSTESAVAHASIENGQPRFHDLAEHLRATAALAAGFAQGFGAADWAHLAGIWHDLGKYRAGFQRKLRVAVDVDAHIETAATRISHSHAGAKHAQRELGKQKGEILAFLIAGHHTGLPDRDESSGAGASLRARLASPMAQTEYQEAMSGGVPADLLAADTPPTSACPGGRDGFALWLRLLFSCLVDADFLDSERFFDLSKHSARSGYPTLQALKSAFDAHMAALSAAACGDGASPSAVNRIRAEVLAQCRAKGADARLKPGFFRLTVPTGGGKTLSSLAFALEHAVRHERRRIVYAIPYTSIIEQTAEVFRSAFAALGDNAVIEHHSNLDVSELRENHASRLAADNWDAPLIVTTNVQLFESLHASRTSRCRKLHNLAGSVIVLDEAQMLPRDFLAPVLRVLRLLVAHYGVSVVLCTATQPMLATRRAPVTNAVLLDGIDDAHDLIDDPLVLYDALRRVDIHMPADPNAPTSWEDLAAGIVAEPAALVIVNTRRQARDLFQLLSDPDAVHLSALMCPAHRSRAIHDIQRRLRARREGDPRPLRVISTSLVEAGVDLDFPAVFRALAGLDSIAQAAGRCNREGRRERGNVHVFVPPGAPPRDTAGHAQLVTKEMTREGLLGDPLAPATFRTYFDRYYAKGGFDKQEIGHLLHPDQAAFRTAAEKFRLIDEDAETVIVPYKPEPDQPSPAGQWLHMLDKQGDAKWLRRKLQRYGVNVPRQIFDRMLRNGDVEERAGLWFAVDSRYDKVLGLLLPDDHGAAESLVF
ncbi:CRISPR-associated endonuclease Cas3'' [Tahibacter sp.]|uniref:CRISPR-associated endonuclease Cas3'' n=1 Tax=Tahibacter sp. TaxID=2056211 RepID=UPI0028C42B9B|nr:CRISPR-associated endonuclease Cas3'' [Tahibacter sp.]